MASRESGRDAGHLSFHTLSPAARLQPRKPIAVGRMAQTSVCGSETQKSQTEVCATKIRKPQASLPAAFLCDKSRIGLSQWLAPFAAGACGDSKVQPTQCRAEPLSPA